MVLYADTEGTPGRIMYMRFFFLFILIIPHFTTAQLKVAKIFSDNMVLQRDHTVHIWGKAVPGKRVDVIFTDEKRNTIAKPDSSWNIYFTKQKANANPQSVFITSAGEKIELKNILIGDIWLCIGQSNMQFSMQEEVHFKDEVKQSGQPLIRLYNPSFIGKNIFGTQYTDSMIRRLAVKDFYSAVPWQTCDSSSVKAMSAVGYYFGKEIVKHKNVPVGLIHLAIGGCPIETFISKDALKRSKRFAVKAKGNWLTNDALPVWVRERGKQNVGDKENIMTDESGPDHGYKPGFAYTAGIEPILGLPIKGAIWYQGESNAQETERVKEYAALQKLMIEDYRNKWHLPQMPFYWVQLSSIDTTNYKSQLWPEFRNEQRLLLDMVQNGGMTVCSDIGFRNNVHPTNKKDVGERLALWALNKTYGEKIIPSGPLPLHAKYINGRIVINFQYAGNDLQISDGKLVRGFSIDGRNETEAIITGKTVVIALKEKPKFVYYGWKSFTDANLVNSELLPASTFKIKVQ
jgi:sialate O-acetylesterase